MESSTPLSSSSSGNNINSNNTIAQDPLALSSETSSLYSSNNSGGNHENSNSQDRQQHELCGNLSTNTQSNNNLSDKENNLNENSLNNGAIYSNDITIKHEDANSLADNRRMQYDSNQIANNNYNNSSNDPRKLNHMSMHQQHLTSHEPHKTFSHSIENLSKTTEKCTPNEIKMYPNLIDSGHEYDDGYETGVGDLMSHKYKLPTLPPPSSSPYSSLSSSSMSTISTSTMTPTNLVNPQQQQSPSYMNNGANGNTGNTMNHYQQQQQQYLQSQQQQYQSMQQQHQNHMNSFNNYHPMFGNRSMQHQAMSNVIKSETSMTSVDNDPYRFVDDDLSNGMNSANGIHNAMHQNYQQMTSPTTVMSGNYPNPNMIQQQQNPAAGNASMMQFNEHHHMSPHNHHHLSHSHPQQIQSQHNMMNGNANAQNIGHAGMNPNMMMMNDTPKKRGRKKKLRDENGNPIEDRPVKERKKHDRFNGMPEEEVTKRTIPDHITNNLDIIIIGINPGLFAAYKGHHYAGPGNHFWKCLYLSGLTSVQMTAEEDYKLMQYGIGFTNMVQRPTKGSADLTRKEIKEGSRILLEKIQKYQPKIAVFNGKLIFEVFSGKKDFCFGKQPETVEGTNTYMWVMPSSSARCAQLPRAADKVPFYGALKKFRDYLNGLVPEYDETDYVFNDPKYSQISTEAELKDDALAFTTLENGEVVMGDPNKKKRGRPKKVRGENGEEIVTPSRRNKNNNENQNSDSIDDDPNKKKRGRPKKVKDGTNTSPTAGKKKSNSNKDKALQQQQSISSPMSGGGNDLSSLSHHQPSPSSQNPQLSSLSNHGNNSNTTSGSSNSQTSFLPPIESPTTALNFQNNGAINPQTIVQQSNNLQSQPMSSPVNLCYPPQASASSMDQSELSQQQHNHVTYQQQRSQIFSNNTSPELAGEITTNNLTDQITSPVAATSPNLPPSEFEPPEPPSNPTQNTNELNHYTQQSATQSLEQQHHHSQSPLSQSQSPLGLSGLYPHAQQQQQQQSMSQMMNNVNNSSIYSPYSRQQSTPQQNYMSMSQSPHHPQTPTQNIAPNNNNNNKPPQQQTQIGQQNNGTTTDLFKDVAAKSLSGLESLVDQIPNINEQDTGLSALSSGAQNVQLQTNEFNMISGYSSSGSTVTTNLTSPSSTLGSSSLLPPTLPHHHSHYTTYTSHANQSPYSASPFSVSSLTSSTYPSAAAMNSYHQNLMGTGHLTSSFMEPHMPVPVSPLYHSYQQQGYPAYAAPPHPSAAAALHMSNYPYYTNMNTGYTQAPGSTYHSMFDRINF